jgi:hypothetical protein
MQRNDIATMILAMLLTTASVLGPGARASCGLTVGIVLLYGIILRLVGTTTRYARIPARLAHVAIAVVATPVGAVLLMRWSAVVGVSLPTSLVAWAGIFGAGAACGRLAASREQTHQTIATSSPTSLAESM